jgi:UPF0716 protein FxsA
MNPWILLAVALYAVVEWFAASWLASVIGWGGVIVVVLAFMAIGIVVMRRAGYAAFRSLRPVPVDGGTVIAAPSQETLEQVGKDMGDAGALFVAGALIALPGLVTTAIGLLLLVPPLRRVARARVSRSIRRRAELMGMTLDARSGTTTVFGDVVRDDAPRPPKGEIISGEVVRDDDDPR